MSLVTYAQSTMLEPMLRAYPDIPSLPLVRTPEVVYLGALQRGERTLDHCCGDGFLASMIWPDGFTAGVDFSEQALATSRKLHRTTTQTHYYEDLQAADVSKHLPFADESFDFIVNNSGLEHVKGVEQALAEIQRVLSPGGRFVFTLAGARAFEWWPEQIDPALREVYYKHQPYHNIHSLEQWRALLAKAGLEIVDYESHFNEQETREILYYDFHHSMAYFTGLALPLKLKLLRMIRPLGRWYFAALVRKATYHSYPNSDEGSFYCITARKPV